MGRYLEIADQALSEIAEDQSLTESEPKIGSPTHCEKSELSEISPEGGSRDAPKIDRGDNDLVQSVDKRSVELQESPDELRRAAEDDWDEIANDPSRLVAFADSLAIKQIRESGGIPDHYTSETECKHCGPVPIWLGCPPQVNGCPWCLNRLAGLPMPGVKE